MGVAAQQAGALLREEGIFRALTWNSQGLHAGLDSTVARNKWNWVTTVLEEERPALVGLLEVSGGMQAMRRLRKEAKRLHYEIDYEMVFNIGHQGGADCPLNGIVVLWCTAQLTALPGAFKL